LTDLVAQYPNPKSSAILFSIMNKKQNNTTKQLYNKKIVNWSQYNQALANRGNITLLIDKQLGFMTDNSGNGQTYHGNRANTHKPGRRFIYSDQLILLVALLRELYHLPLRQTIGFSISVFKLSHLGVSVPNYTTLCRRLKHVTIPLGARSYNPSQPLVALIDSTGLKIMGEGEWTIRKHGKSYARDWRKVHLAIDYGSRDIIAVTTTDADTPDISGLEPILRQCTKQSLRPETVIGDGAYEGLQAHIKAKRHKTTLISPPRVDAITHPEDPRLRLRDSYIKEVRRLGIDTWKEQVGYHRRSLAETTMFRLKSSFTSSLRSKTEVNQTAEIKLRVNLLNYFTSLGLPKYQPA
jgi:hypothetical protein